MKRIRTTLIVTALLLCGAALAMGQTSWGAIVKSSQRIDFGPDGGVAYGEVGTGFAAFSFDVEETGPLSLEVVVTEIRQGTEYEDDDSMLFLFDSDGYLVHYNDDGPYGSQSLILVGTQSCRLWMYSYSTYSRWLAPGADTLSTTFRDSLFTALPLIEKLSTVGGATGTSGASTRTVRLIRLFSGLSSA